MRFLFEHGARICGDEMEVAAKCGRWDVVRTLAAQGAGSGKPICNVVEYERGDIVRELVDKGASPEGGVGTAALAAAKRRRKDCNP